MKCITALADLTEIWSFARACSTGNRSCCKKPPCTDLVSTSASGMTAEPGSARRWWETNGTALPVPQPWARGAKNQTSHGGSSPCAHHSAQWPQLSAAAPSTRTARTGFSQDVSLCCAAAASKGDAEQLCLQSKTDTLPSCLLLLGFGFGLLAYAPQIQKLSSVCIYILYLYHI